MKTFTLLGKILFLITAFSSSLLAQTYTVEAEDGIITGASIQTNIAGYSGTGYVGHFESDNGQIELTVNVQDAGTYALTMSYNGQYGTKNQDIYINGGFIGNIEFPQTTAIEFVTTKDISVDLNAGENTLLFKKSWGWMYIDNFTFTSTTIPPHDYSLVDRDLIDLNANDKTIALYEYLKSTYGNKVIAGQTHNFDRLEELAEKKPAQRAWDFQHYTKGYAYKWDNQINGHSFNWDDPKVTEEAIDWYNETNGCGIVSFQWHWHAPKGIGSVAGTNSFYTNATTFDLAQALNPTHEHYDYLIEDIDSIATQLKKLQTAGVPVLWRPLHEAGGEWFWWGAKGADACLDLWDIMYDRLTNHHQLHNLIWVWSTPEEEWYPGNNNIDIFGYDSYPGEFIYASQKIKFHELYEISEGKKIIAMTENGPIPDVDKLIEDDAMWSYFSSWNELVEDQNSTDHIKGVFANNNVVTLENKVCDEPLSLAFESSNTLEVYPNPSNGLFHLATNASWTVFDMYGIELNSGTSKEVNLSGFPSGVYILNIDGHSTRIVKN